MISVLLVDDEPVLLDIGRMFLEKTGGFSIGEASSGKEALEILSHIKYDVIVADYEMPGMDGLALLREVRKTWPDIAYILFTGRGREEVVIEALNSGADFYLQKGGDPKSQFTELVHKVNLAVSARKATTEIREKEETFRQFFEAAGDAIVIIDKDVIVDCNQRTIALIAKNRSDIVDKPIFELLDQSCYQEEKALTSIRDTLSAALSGKTVLTEWCISKSDDSPVDTEVTLSGITIHGRKLVHAIVRDISARKHEEETKAVNELRLKAMLDLYAIRDSNLKEITGYAIQSAARISRSTHAYLAFVNEEESQITIYASSEENTGAHSFTEKPISFGVDETDSWGQAIRERKPVIINTESAEAATHRGFPGIQIQVIRHASIPIFDQDRIVLLVGVVNKEKPYSDEDITQLTLLMTGMWGIVRRKKTEDILQKKNFELASAYEQLRTIEEELRKNYNDIRSSAASLAESEDRFRRLSDLAPVYIMMGDEQGNIVYMNNYWRELFITQDQNPGVQWSKSIYSEDKERILQTYKDRFTEKRPCTDEYRIVQPSGKILWLFRKTIPRTTSDGRYLGYIDVSVDISDRKEMETALRESEERYRGLVERNEDLIILLNDQLIPIYVSPSVQYITGYQPSQILMKSLKPELFLPEDQQKIAAMITEARSGIAVSPIEIRFRKKDGAYAILDMRGAPIHHDGKFSGIQVIARDISARKRLEEELLHANFRLRLLSELTSHDILNHLTTLNGFLDITREEVPLSSDLSGVVQAAHQAVVKIQYLVEFSRDYQSLGLFEPKWIDAGEALSTAISQLPSHSLAIHNRLNNILIKGDHLFSRALFNLIENSLRHGQKVTTIDISSEIKTDNLVIVVSDDGIGVPIDKKKMIFERGVGNNTGLGLFLVREILESIGFTIHETGVFGVGARFEIIISANLYRIETKVQ